MENEGGQYKFTPEEKQIILGHLKDDAFYNLIKKVTGLIQMEEGMKLIRMIRSDKPDEECLAAIRTARGGTEMVGQFLAYMAGCRKEINKLDEEEKDGKKKR